MDDLFQLFKEEFDSLKKKRGVLEMSDLELLTDQAIQKEPDLADCFAKEWDYWFVDEYQDTSPLQVRILNKLMGDRPYFLVGDPQQSIYLFRGARSEVFESKEKEVQSQGGQLSFLDKNYRSLPELLHFFNDFFSGISPHFQPMQAKEDQVNPKQWVATYSIADEGETEKTQNENIAIYNHIQNLMETGGQYEDICILGRTHNHLNEIAHFLNSQGLHPHVHASTGFHERREIGDALGVLKFIINPHDNFNLIMVLRSPWFHVDDKLIVDALQEDSWPRSYWEKLSLLLKENESITKLNKLLQELPQWGVSESLKMALIESGIFDLARKQDSSGRRESNLWKLLTQLDNMERQPGFNYLNFTNKLLKGEWEEGGDAVACLEPNRINLMTIHASKGLKFKHIVLPRMDRRPNVTETSSQKPLINIDEKNQKWTIAVPLGESQQIKHSPIAQELFKQLSQREREESNRLLYVALTRAEESVFLSWVEKKGGNNKVGKGSWAEKLSSQIDRNTNFLTETSTEELVTKDSYSFKIQRGSWEKKKSYKKDLVQELRASSRPKWVAPMENQKQKTSVSQLLEDGEDKKTLQGGAPFLKVISKANEGTLIHKVMESLRYPNLVDVDYENWLKREFGDGYECMRTAIDFIQNLKIPPMQELLKMGFVEWGFQMKRNDENGESIAQGVIDLWGEVDDGKGVKTCWIIDYKSGSETYIEKAFHQLHFYEQALRKYGVKSKVKQAVIYPLSEIVEIRE